MHKIFGIKEDAEYLDRKGVYLIPIKNDSVGVIQTSKGFFLLGGGLDTGETDVSCIKRECMEEAGYTVSIKYKIGSAEMYCKIPKIGYFHPIQTYYVGELLEKVQTPIEDDHTLVWFKFSDLRGKMSLEMQNWALEAALKLILSVRN